jgi:hypothetical protein
MVDGTEGEFASDKPIDPADLSEIERKRRVAAFLLKLADADGVSGSSADGIITKVRVGIDVALAEALRTQRLAPAEYSRLYRLGQIFRSAEARWTGTGAAP